MWATPRIRDAVIQKQQFDSRLLLRNGGRYDTILTASQRAAFMLRCQLSDGTADHTVSQPLKYREVERTMKLGIVISEPDFVNPRSFM